MDKYILIIESQAVNQLAVLISTWTHNKVVSISTSFALHFQKWAFVSMPPQGV